MFTKVIFVIVVWTLGILAAEEKVELYLDIRQVNSSDTLQRILELPIVYYRFLHDNNINRVQLGPIGPDAHRLFPDSIEVLPSASFTNFSAIATGGKPVTHTVRNFPVVDKNVLFMHGLVALQELITRYEALQSEIGSLNERDQSVYDEIRRTQTMLEKTVDHQLQMKVEALQLEAATAEAKLTRERAREDEELERARQRVLEERSLLQLEEDLTRERLQQQEVLARQTVAAQLQMERDVAERRSVLQQATAQKLESLRAQQQQDLQSQRLTFEKEKIRAEVAAKAEQDRISEEMQVQKIKLQAQLETERMVQGIKNVSQQATVLIRSLLAQPMQLLVFAGVFLGVIFCYYLLRELSVLLRQVIQSRLGRPVLVRETSYHWSLIPVALESWLFARPTLTTSSIDKDFADIILAPADKERILHLALATRNTKHAQAPFRHVLLHGPPGTGKTLIARRLAQSSGLDYAILSGGDVAPLGEDAVNQLHALFRWAQKSRRGLLVFIDEAEAFLCSRAMQQEGGSSMSAAGSANSSSHLRNALNALLYQTGTPSTSFMLVLATNRPQDLDAAVLDRMDVSLQISLPQKPQRRELLRWYFAEHVETVVQRSFHRAVWWRRWLHMALGGAASGLSIDPQCLSDDAMEEMVQLSEGFSGREIAKLMVSVQYVLLLSAERCLRWAMLRETVQRKAEEHRLKSSGFSNMQTANVMQLAAAGTGNGAFATSRPQPLLSSLASTSDSRRSTMTKKTRKVEDDDAAEGSEEVVMEDDLQSVLSNASYASSATDGRRSSLRRGRSIATPNEFMPAGNALARSSKRTVRTSTG